MIFVSQWRQKGEHHQQQKNHSNTWKGYFIEFPVHIPVHILRNHNSASRECGLLVSKQWKMQALHTAEWLLSYLATTSV